ncbi:MAG TPA: NFACT RNA binding domain-containing protein, partial [Longimicrobium sp.]|nr:NFACT RNA binding domain-containing protein [Longimicrobium sp.]
AFVQKAWVPQPKLCFLDLRQVGRSVLLCLSAQPELARLSVVDERFPSPPEPPAFQRWLRQEVVGAKLTAVRVLAKERLLRLELEKGGEPRALVLELRGSSGHLVLLGREDRVLAGAEHVPGRADLRPGGSYTPPPGELSPEALALPSRLAPRGEHPFPFAQAAEALYGERDKGKRADEIRRRLVSPVKAKVARLQRTVEKVRAEAHRTEAAEEHKRVGELLAQNAYRLTRGQRSVRLTEYTDEGPREVEVPLDPKRSPKEEVEWHFNRYRRLLRGSEAAGKRLLQLEEELAHARAQLQRLQQATGEELLSRDDAPDISRPAPKAAQPVARPYKEYASAKGERIFVGKSSEGNDELTFHIARPYDLWLHARGVPGSHVVVPLARDAVLPQELLLDAAHLALHNSLLKGEPRGEVIYTYARFVRKMKGGGPGQVVYTREKGFLVRMEPERLKRLLESRDAVPGDEA